MGRHEWPRVVFQEELRGPLREVRRRWGEAEDGKCYGVAEKAAEWDLRGGEVDLEGATVKAE